MQIQIGNLKIGDAQPCRVIAEICNNHMGSLAFALEMATQAKRCGADIVKSQYGFEDIRRKKRVLVIEEHAILRDHCEDIGVEYLCTPFTIEAAKELNDIGLKAFKIGSGQSGDEKFVDAVREFGKPVIASHPDIYIPDGFDFELVVDKLDCVQSTDGYSCHSPTIYPALAAVALGAKVVEKHVIWDKQQICPDQMNSIDFNQLKEMVKAIREIEANL